MNGRTTKLELLGCAVASAATYYLFFTSPFSLLSYYASPLLDLGKLTDHSREGALLFMAANTALFLLYVVAVNIARQAHQSALVRATIVVAPMLFALILLFAYPVGAVDVFDYAFHAKMLALYHANPLTHIPAEFASDPWFRYIGWKVATSPYGPVWIYLSTFIYSLAGNDLLDNLLAFKLLASLALFACAGLVYLVLRAGRPSEALSGFALVAWNPLLLGEMAMNGHNDVLMTALILGGLWSYRRRHFTAAIASLIVAGLVKAPALALLPLVGVAALRALSTRRERLRLVLSAALCALVLVIGAYAPSWSGAGPLESLMAHGDLFTSSPASVLWHALQLNMNPDEARDLVRLTAVVVFCVAYIWIAFRADGTFASLASNAFAVMLLMLTTITFWFQPWYLVWLLPLAPLATRTQERFAGIFSWSALWAYFLFDFAWLWNLEFFNQGNSLVLNATALLLIFAPPLLYRFGDALLTRLPPSQPGKSQLTPLTPN